jgi:hypothetical protein
MGEACSFTGMREKFVIGPEVARAVAGTGVR